MVAIRLATVDDTPLIADQRRQMFEDSGQLPPGKLPELTPNFIAWLAPRLAAAEYLGWIAEHEGRPIGGAGLWLVPFPPHWMDPEPMRAYLLNFYVAPEMRGQRIAGQLLDLTIAEARRRNVNVVTLQASKFGKPIYERYGFTGTNEMILAPRLKPMPSQVRHGLASALLDGTASAVPSSRRRSAASAAEVCASPATALYFVLPCAYT